MSDILKKQFNFLDKLAGFITTAGIIGGAYYYYRQTIWRPTLKVVSVDWSKPIATVQVGYFNNVVTLQKNQIISVGGDFGLQFSGDTDDSVNRIELYKWPLTYKVIATKS